MNTKYKIFAIAFLAISFYTFANIRMAFAAACVSNGGSCWAVDNCNNYMSGGKDLLPVPAGDAACAQVYEKPVKCCKIGGVSSSKPAAKQDGTDVSSAGAQSASSGPNCPTCFTNPLRFSSVEDFLTNGLLVAIQRIIVVLALVMIVIGGLLYTTSGGSDQAKTAKNMITAALIGLAIAIAAPSILKELSSVLGWTETKNATVDAAPSLIMIATRILNFLLGIAGIIALIMIVIGAITYLTSAGDDKKAETGKKIFQYALLGILIAMSAMIMVTQVAKFFAG